MYLFFFSLQHLRSVVLVPPHMLHITPGTSHSSLTRPPTPRVFVAPGTMVARGFQGPWRGFLTQTRVWVQDILSLFFMSVRSQPPSADASPASRRCVGCEVVLSGIEEQVSRANQHKEQQLGLKQQIESEVSRRGIGTDPGSRSPGPLSCAEGLGPWL